MKPLQRKILEQLIDGLAEPVMVSRVDSSNWPIVMCNPAFDQIAGAESVKGQPLADTVEELLGRELAVEISEAIRRGKEANLAVELGAREYLLVLKPMTLDNNRDRRYYAGYWRAALSGESAGDHSEMHQALQKAKRRIRDLSRDDPVTGLLNAAAFREVLAHDWAVAARENAALSLVAFELRDFDDYLQVFGSHASDSCQRRVAQAIRRCLRRASDVAARIDDEGGDRLVVLSHASEKAGVEQFAGNIAEAVRELGLHHPRSKESRFVTVSYKTAVMQAGKDNEDAVTFLARVL